MSEKSDLNHEIAVLKLVLSRGVAMEAWKDATDDHAAIRRTIKRLEIYRRGKEGM